MEGRDLKLTGSNVPYEYGFNGMIKDDEIKGEGNSYDYGARMHDPRIGRFLSLDPKAGNYPSMSSYCYAGNSPVLFNDENGEGPNPPFRKWMTLVLYKFYPNVLSALLASNNTSQRELEKWIFGGSTDPSAGNKIKGALGESIVAAKIHSDLADNNTKMMGFPKVELQERPSKSTNYSRPDIVLEFTVGEFRTVEGTSFYKREYEVFLPFNNADGSEYDEEYETDCYCAVGGGIENYRVSYEVKTLNSENSGRSRRNNRAQLRNGMKQVQFRLDNGGMFDGFTEEGVLVTDLDAYMNIYNDAQNGGKASKKFIQEVQNFLANGGRLSLVQGLYERSGLKADELKLIMKDLDQSAPK